MDFPERVFLSFFLLVMDMKSINIFCWNCKGITSGDTSTQFKCPLKKHNSMLPALLKPERILPGLTACVPSSLVLGLGLLF